jgi:hypothetical protein
MVAVIVVAVVVVAVIIVLIVIVHGTAIKKQQTAREENRK